MRRGFTLLELLLTIGIMLVVGRLATGFYARFLTQNAVANTVDQIVQDIRKAQFYSMVSRKNNVSGWGVNFTAPTLTLYQGGSFGTRNTALDEKFTVSSSITVTGLTDINFPRLNGIPAAGATITVSGLGTSKTVTVNNQGVVTR